MAVPEQLQRLTRSIAEWNQWREEYPEQYPDLSHANLDRANLAYANLNHAHLENTLLGRSWLHGATFLEQIVVYRTNFERADLRGIPWLLLMELTMQPKTLFAGIRYDHPIPETFS